MLHPYYKLRYIKKKWGGEAEQQAEIAAGNLDAVNWTAHAREVVDNAVGVSHLIRTVFYAYTYLQMEHYWPKCLGRQTKADVSAETGTAGASSPGRTRTDPADGTTSDSEDEFDRERAQLFNSESSSGWKQELRAYLEDPALTIKKDCDTVEWWSVSGEIESLSL